MKQEKVTYQSLLRLEDWDICVVEEPNLVNNAEAKMIYNDCKAIIRINADLSQEEKEKALVHEMLHLIFRDAYDIFVEQCRNEFAKEYCTRQHERAIEKTAKVIHSLNREYQKELVERCRLEHKLLEVPDGR
jgi:Zn-dependent peptidase ImmA (M78 family)